MGEKKLSVLTWIAIVFIILGLITGIYLNVVSKGHLPLNYFFMGCGIFGFLFCCLLMFISGIGGLILEIKRKNYRGIIICIAGLLIYFILISVVRDSSKRITCASTLRCIGLALQQYAMDYSDNFPPASGAPGLEYLRKYDYLTDYAAYACPNTKTVRCTGNQPLTEAIVDYVYVGGLNGKSDQNTPILYDKPGNHTDCCNVGTVDGTVKCVSGKNWMEKIKK